jgi:hypothetical protein
MIEELKSEEGSAEIIPHVHPDHVAGGYARSNLGKSW